LAGGGWWRAALGALDRAGDLLARAGSDRADARRFAQAALIPEELLERPLNDLRRTAAALGVPVCELLEAR
jgi:hypothetical protein